jgi:hypothetical protein
MLTKTNMALTTAGVAVLASFLVSTVLLMTASYHSDQRALAFGAVSASGWLEIVWSSITAAFAVFRWRMTNPSLRAILLVNGIIAVLLLGSTLRS